MTRYPPGRFLAAALLLAWVGCGGGQGANGGAIVVFRESPSATPNPDPKAVSFYVAFLTPRPPGCSQTCCYSPTETNSPGDGDAVLQNAGDITVADETVSPSSPLGVLTFQSSPGAPSQYVMLSNTDDFCPEPVWTGGDELSVSATGGSGGGAFTGTIRSVALLAGLTPPLAFGGTGTVVPLGQDFQVRWAPDPGGTAGEAVQVTLSGSGGAQIVCTAQDSQAGLTVPASLLSHFQPAAGGSIAFERFATAATDSADVTLMSTTDALGYATYQ